MMLLVIQWGIREKHKAWQRKVVSFEYIELLPGFVNMELQREMQVGYMHLGVIHVFMIMDAMGVDGVSWGGTESRTRVASRRETGVGGMLWVGEKRRPPRTPRSGLTSRHFGLLLSDR